MWWRAEGKGYTANIDDAGQYGEEEARRIERNRDADKPIPVKVVLSAVSRVVNAGALHRAIEAAALPGSGQ